LNDTPEAFESLFRDEYPRLCRALSSFGDGVEEAVQEAFVKALTRWSRVGSMDNPAGWVRTVAVRQLLNTRRSHSREFAASARLGPPVTEFTLDDTLAVRSVLASLTPQQRIAVGLYYGGGYPIAGVADAMELSEGAVKYHLHAARERLRDALTEDRDG
jgi:RNA polymerase sigma-70 factor, ECF subfamily